MSGRFDQQVLKALGAIPVGQKLPMSSIARQLDCSVSVLGTAIEQLIGAGKVDRGMLRPVAAVPPPPARETLPGLFDRIVAEGKRRGMPTRQVSLEIFRNPNAIYGLRQNRSLRASTLDKIDRWMQRGNETPAAIDATGGDTAPSPESEPSAKRPDSGDQGAEDEAGPVPARAASADDAGPADPSTLPAVSIALMVTQPTGLQLVDAIFVQATALGENVTSFAERIYPINTHWKLEQLRIARRPMPATIERVRALLRGETPEPPPQRGQAPTRAKQLSEQMREKSATAREGLMERKREVDTARETRRPGEPLDEAVRRVREDDAREVATIAGPKARSFQPLPPPLWQELRSLAEERGEAPTDLLPLAVERGLEALRAEA